MMSAEALVRAAADAGVTIATAESCTGGMIAASLTEVPGASAVFTHGIVAYANEAKIGVLGVPPMLIADHGAVSGQVAEAMAEGVAKLSGADLAISVTGVAGPDGGTPDKPVGLVWFGLAVGGLVLSHHRVFTDDTRAGIRAAAKDYALDLLSKAL